MGKMDGMWSLLISFRKDRNMIFLFTDVYFPKSLHSDTSLTFVRKSDSGDHVYIMIYEKSHLLNSDSIELLVL